MRDTARLVEPDHSIGPGICEAACPAETIQPMFRTKEWEIDLPLVTSTVATNVPGIFLAGELDGMELIRKGSNQGARAIESIRGKRGAPMHWMW